MTKITFIGAGSTVFAKNLLGDILSFPELANSTISLMDIDPVRLKTSEIVAHKVADFFGAKPKIEATLDRRAALDGADYAISMFQVGGYKPSTVIGFVDRPGVHRHRVDVLEEHHIGAEFFHIFADIEEDRDGA